MARRYSFPELGCCNCDHYLRMGNGPSTTRYCNGFPKKRKPKRFRSSDPKYKAPKWCPRRLSPPICRIYGFADEQSSLMDHLTRERFDPKRDHFITPLSSRYKLRLEMPLNMKAKAFFEEVRHGTVYDLLPDLQLGEIVEIDDGLKPYFFYYLNWSTVVPVLYFNRSGISEHGGGRP